MNKNDFLTRAKLFHRDKYDYFLMEYINVKTKIKIICPKHGLFFQTPDAHFRSGCKKCGTESAHLKQRSNTLDFVEKAKKIHKDFYNYSRVDYIANDKKVIITCKLHGDFSQSPANHLIGKGCSECNKEKLRKKFAKTTDNFINESKSKFKDFFDYSSTVYCSGRIPVEIKCPVHGIFKINPYYHLKSNYGCTKCGRVAGGVFKQKGNDFYIKAFTYKHGKKYIYPNLDNLVLKRANKINVICPIHGLFTVSVSNHLAGNGCIKCAYKNTKIELSIQKILKEININFIEKDRIVIRPKELDIFIPNYNLAIDCHGIYWHSNKTKKGQFYHLNKTEKCNQKQTKLIQLFETEIISKSKPIKHLIRKNLNKLKYFIDGLSCNIKIVNIDDKVKFLTKYYLFGDHDSDINIGLFKNNRLVCLLSANKVKTDLFEITSFVEMYNFNIGSGFEVLLNFFESNYYPKTIIIKLDRRIYCEKDFLKYGFNLHKYIGPRLLIYDYKNKNKLLTYYQMKKNIDKIKNIKQWVRIYDCGLIVLKKDF